MSAESDAWLDDELSESEYTRCAVDLQAGGAEGVGFESFASCRWAWEMMANLIVVAILSGSESRRDGKCETNYMIMMKGKCFTRVSLRRLY